MEPTELAWLAGILEGEGSFLSEPRPRDKRRAVLQVKMSDLDTMEKVLGLVGGSLYIETPRNPEHKTLYRARIRGARAREIMGLILPYMSARRTERIREILAETSEGRRV